MFNVYNVQGTSPQAKLLNSEHHLTFPITDLPRKLLNGCTLKEKVLRKEQERSSTNEDKRAWTCYLRNNRARNQQGL